MSQISPQEMLNIKQAIYDELQSVLYALRPKGSLEARCIIKDRLKAIEQEIQRLAEQISERG